ncbi:MAG: response regulator [Spirochaetales bacterium]|nr:response regulator [Spirochaetales bacterium]
MTAIRINNSFTGIPKEQYKILIVDDDKGLNHLLSLKLGREGYLISSVYTGQETFNTIEMDNNMVLLIDYQLPDMTAVDVLKKLQDLKWPGLFLIMTGHGDERFAVELMKQGAVDYVVKDSNFIEVISQKIQRACDIIHDRKALQTAEEQRKKAEQENIRLAAFPEVNPCPVLEINSRGNLNYINPAARALFPEIMEKGMKHPFLKGIDEIAASMRLGHEKIHAREIKAGNIYFHQTISYVPEISSVHVYSLDISELKHTERQLIDTIHEKEILLHELYHRTKNNLQVIVSMLNMYSGEVNDEKLDTLFSELTIKIHSMALVHQTLYESKNLARLNLNEYLSSLVRQIIQCCINSDNLQLKYEGEDIFVDIDIASPLGLVISELISNCLRHAFPDNRNGIVSIKMHISPNGDLIIEIMDDGAGVPADFSPKKHFHLGLNTVFDMIKHQLQGQITFVSEQGLCWKIKIPKKD